jgi:hypothetical protein
MAEREARFVLFCVILHIFICLLMTGQAVPPGLHVRLNLQTGSREAKLLDEEEAPPKEKAQPSGWSSSFSLY